MYYLDVLNIKDNKRFRMKFATEFERDKMKRKLRYSHKLICLS